MNYGYGHKLFVLAFDHRGSFQKKWFGLEGEPTEEDTRRISDAKHLVFEGLLHALEEGATADSTGALVDEQFGAPTRIPSEAKERGLKLAMPVEKSGQNEFDFEYWPTSSAPTSSSSIQTSRRCSSATTRTTRTPT